jgi:thiol:disulfide interchange protein
MQGKLSAAMCILFLSAVVFAQNAKPTEVKSPGPKNSNKNVLPTNFDPTRDPANDLKLAIAEASRTNRRILLDVGGQWCVWCKYFDNFFEQNGSLRQFREEHFVTVHVNFSKENENKTFLSRYPKTPGYPHIFVLESDGTLLHSQNTSELEEGKGYNLQAVGKFLQTWAKAKS